MNADPIGKEGRAVFALAFSAGAVDAVGFLTLGELFVAHMSGNTAAFGSYFGEGNWRVGFPHLFAIACFVIALFGGYLWLMRRGGLRPVLWTEAALLALFGILACRGDIPPNPAAGYYAIAALPVAAMGLQNSTLRHLGTLSVHTTYVTGVLDGLCENLARSVSGFLDEWKMRGWRSASSGWLRRAETIAAARAALLWGSYVLGALVGSWGLLAGGAAIVFLPVLVLGILTVFLGRGI